MQSFSDMVRATASTRVVVSSLINYVQSDTMIDSVAGADGATGPIGADGATGPSGPATVVIASTLAEIQALTPTNDVVVIFDNDVWTYIDASSGEGDALAADTYQGAYAHADGQTFPAWKRQVDRYSPEHFGATGHATTADAVSAGVGSSVAIQQGILVAALNHTGFNFPPKTYALDATIDIDTATAITSDSGATVCALSGTLVAFHILTDTQGPVQLPSVDGFVGVGIELGASTAVAITATVDARDIKNCGTAVRFKGVESGKVVVMRVSGCTTAVAFELQTNNTEFMADQVVDVDTVVMFLDNTSATVEANNKFHANTITNTDAFIRCTNPSTVGSFSATVPSNLSFRDPVGTSTRLVDGNFDLLDLVVGSDDVRRHHVVSDDLGTVIAGVYASQLSPIVVADSTKPSVPEYSSATTLNLQVDVVADLANGESQTVYFWHVLGGHRWTATCASAHTVVASVVDEPDGVERAIRVTITNVGGTVLPLSSVVKLFLRRH